MRIALALSAIALGMGQSAQAAVTETVLHGFSGTGTWHPTALTRDAAGNLYGIDDQSIFELKPTPAGAWKEITLYTFPVNQNLQPANPKGPLLLDAAGNLYGVTQQAGYTNCTQLGGCGTVFELSPGNGGWQVSTLYNFGGFPAGDGVVPTGGLVFDSAGNLFGETQQGGTNACPYPSNGCGTVFELSPDSGSWKETIVHSFSVKGTEGVFPFGRLTLDSAGNLFGTTQRGTVFELSPAPGGYVETTLSNVANNAKTFLNGGLVLDPAGNVYGTTYAGVFELLPNPGGTFWKYKVVYDFAGANPGDLIFDQAGNLFGDTTGANIGNGTLFELTPAGGGIWNLTTLYTFTGGVDGASPKDLITDAAGNFYATSFRPVGDLRNGLDEVLKLSLGPKGLWQATVLLSGNCKDGFFPSAGVILDAAGNLYGTTSLGGKDGFGTVYKASSTPSGWKTTILYNFRGGPDGGIPKAGLIFDAAGNLYGTTTLGGNRTNCSQGCGTVFELSPVKNTWKQHTLYSFSGGSDGAVPLAGLIFDATGNLYGTASIGGDATCVTPLSPTGCGTVFELSPGQHAWKQSTLYSFTGGSDGSGPVAGLIFDAAGNLYGTTELGGIISANSCNNYGCGAVFELSPGMGAWKLTPLYGFTGGSDGLNPVAGLVFDGAGNLYGTTEFGGTFFAGVAFKLTPSPSDWTESVLHEFGYVYADGTYPTGGLTFDTAGNLYGTTVVGGTLPGNIGGFGVVFELLPSPGGDWTESILFTMGGTYGGGAIVQSGVTLDAAGNLYGTTFGWDYFYSPPSQNCSGACGTVFEISGR